VHAPDIDAEYLGYLLFRVTQGQYVQITFWDNQGGTSRNAVQRLACTDPLANPDRTSLTRSPW